MSGITLYYASVLHAAQYSAWCDDARYTAWRDDRVSRCTLKRANQNSCWADWTQMRMSIIRGIPQTAAHFFLRVLLSPSFRYAIF